jgi:hypothetical protein
MTNMPAALVWIMGSDLDFMHATQAWARTQSYD